AMLARLDQRFGGDAGVQAVLADLYTRWGKDALALAAYQRLAAIEPDDVNHLVNLGEQHCQKGDRKKALEIRRKIAADRRPESQGRLAEVYAEHDMLPEALDLYGKTIKARPDGVELYKGRAAVHERMKQLAPALADWEKVLSLAPAGDPGRASRREARRQIVSLLRRHGGRRLDSRIVGWEAAFRRTPPALDAGYFLVEAYLRKADGP